MFEKMILGLKIKLNESGMLGDMAFSDRELAREQFDLANRGLANNQLGPEERAAAIADLVAQVNRDITSQQTLTDYGLENPPGAVEKAQANIDLLRSLGQTVDVPQGLAIRRVGTLRATGKTTEPEDTTAKIHAGERVLNPQEASAYNSQSDLGGAINRLNTTTAQLVTLMKQNNRITSGISNDFLKGSLTV